MQHPSLLSLSPIQSFLPPPPRTHLSYTDKICMAWHSSYQIKKYKNKIIYDQLAHWNGFVFHKNEGDATKGGVRAGVVRFL